MLACSMPISFKADSQWVNEAVQEAADMFEKMVNLVELVNVFLDHPPRSTSKPVKNQY